MQISPADRSIAIVVKADGAGATASQSPAAASTAPAKTTATVSDAARTGLTLSGEANGDYLNATQGATGPDTPSADASNRDWAATPKVAEEKKEAPKEEIKPRLFELLIEQFNSLWRASAQAVADPSVQNQALIQAKGQETESSTKNSPLVYTDPSKVRKTSSAEGA